MVKFLRRLLPAFVLFTLTICEGGSVRREMRWVVCYSDKPRVEEFAGYDLVVLDSDAHPSLAYGIDKAWVSAGLSQRGRSRKSPRLLRRR